MIMGDVSLPMLMTLLPMKMKISRAWSLDHHLATGYITGTFPCTRMVLFNIFIFIASTGLGIALMSKSWLLQQGDEQISRKKSKKDLFH